MVTARHVILAVHGGRSPAQAGSRCLEDPEGGNHHAVVRSEPRRMNRPQVAYFLSGVLAHFPTGARTTGPPRLQEHSLTPLLPATCLTCERVFMTPAFDLQFDEGGGFGFTVNPAPCPFPDCGGVGRPTKMNTAEHLKVWQGALREIAIELARRGHFNNVVDDVLRMKSADASTDEITALLTESSPALAALFAWIRNAAGQIDQKTWATLIAPFITILLSKGCETPSATIQNFYIEHRMLIEPSSRERHIGSQQSALQDSHLPIVTPLPSHAASPTVALRDCWCGRRDAHNHGNGVVQVR